MTDVRVDPAAGLPAPEPPLLELRAARAGYGAIEVLHGVDLPVPAGSVVALLGPNGGGKTTTLKVCAGLLPLTGGDLLLAGRSVNGVAASQLARLGVCSIPEGRGVFPNLSVRENLWLATGTGSELAAQGLSILVAEQFARTVLPFAHVAAIMLHGRIVRIGSPGEIEEELSTHYLGG